MQYMKLMESGSIQGLVPLIDSCRTCKNKLNGKQEIDHTSMQCLNQRCDFLESEMTELNDHQMKSHLQIRALEGQVNVLEEAIRKLTMPKQRQAMPFAFAEGHKLRHQLRTDQSEDLLALKADINYDNIIQPPTSSNREHIGLFGSLGASSQR